jgi:membrane protease YdiL (CAAX protease family)
MTAPARDAGTMTSDAAINTTRWTGWRITAYFVLVLITFLVAQFLGVAALAVMLALGDPAFDAREWLDQNQMSGNVLFAGALASTAICVPLIVALAGSDRWRFLGIQKTSVRSLLVWCGVLIAFVAVSDLITVSLGRPIVPDVMLEGFSAGHTISLLLALLLLAPLFEELFFRGFLLGALQAAGAHQWVAAATTSALWSVLHLQYDLYGIVSIFAGGLLLAAARFSTGSILPCLGMHGLMNLIASVETAYRASTAAG